MILVEELFIFFGWFQLQCLPYRHTHPGSKYYAKHKTMKWHLNEFGHFVSEELTDTISLHDFVATSFQVSHCLFRRGRALNSAWATAPKLRSALVSLVVNDNSCAKQSHYQDVINKDYNCRKDAKTLNGSQRCNKCAEKGKTSSC